MVKQIEKVKRGVTRRKVNEQVVRKTNETKKDRKIGRHL